MQDRAEQLHQGIERLLEEGSLDAEDAAQDPLLPIAAALHDSLKPESPSAEFRARLKAELLERYSNNVVPFPAAGHGVPDARGPLNSRARIIRRRAFSAALALGVAAAAALALIVGYSSMQQRTQQSPKTLSQPIALTTPSATATQLPPLARTPNGEQNPVQPGKTAGSPPRHTAVRTHRLTGTATPVQVAYTVATDTDTPAPTPPAPTATESRPSTASPTAAPPSDTVVPTASPAGPTPVPTVTAAQQTNTPSVPTATGLPSSTPAPPSPTIVPTGTAAPTNTPQPATATPQLPTSTPTEQPTQAPSSTATVPAVPTAQATATAVPPTATPVQAVDTATVIPANTPLPPVATPIPPTATRLPPSATSSPVPPTATGTAQVPSSTATPVPHATSTVAPTSTPQGTDTPQPGQAASTPVMATIAPSPTAPAEVAQVSPTATYPLSRPAVRSAVGTPATSTPSATVPAGLGRFPVPALTNAGDESPLRQAQTQPKGPPLQSTAALASDPGMDLAVFAPMPPQESPQQMLKLFALTLKKTVSQDNAGGMTALVGAGAHTYRAIVQPKSYGYRLILTMQDTASGGGPTVDTGTAETLALGFLQAHHLADGLRVLSSGYDNLGNLHVTFTESVLGSFPISGTWTSVVLNNKGVVLTVDARWLNTSAMRVAPRISPEMALQAAAAGQGYISFGSTGATLDPSSVVTKLEIIYVPVIGSDGLYYEPMYTFSGTTGGGAPFMLYVPALQGTYYLP